MQTAVTSARIPMVAMWAEMTWFPLEYLFISTHQREQPKGKCNLYFYDFWKTTTKIPRSFLQQPIVLHGSNISRWIAVHSRVSCTEIYWSECAPFSSAAFYFQGFCFRGHACRLQQVEPYWSEWWTLMCFYKFIFAWKTWLSSWGVSGC